MSKTQFGPPTGPGNNATVTLFDSTVTFPGGLHAAGVRTLYLAFPSISQASAASGLIGYVSGDKGTTWNQHSFAATGSAESLPATVAADTGTDFDTYIIDIAAYPDVKVTYTAGATAPSAATWARVGIAADDEE